MAAPSRNPTPVRHPPSANAPHVPRTATTVRVRPMRAATCSKLSGSGAVVMGVPRNLANQSDETGHASQNQKNDLQPGGAEIFIEIVADRVPDNRGCRQQHGE